jgi:aminomethyltransferase
MSNAGPGMTLQPAESALRRTPLHRLNAERGARFVPFAGYEMPVQFLAGVLKEHLHTRQSAGLFDVSHMGQILVRPRDGNIASAALALERLMPQDILSLALGRQRYAQFTNDVGGLLDDLMVAHRGDHFQLIVNAACKDFDEAHLRTSLGDTCAVERRDDGLLALQGPRAAEALASLCPDAAAMRFMDVRELAIAGARCVVSRSGYTGEDGYEICVPSAATETVARHLLEHPAVAPIGLGARDSLRLEAGLCLYGSDTDITTTPVEAALEWAIPKSRRAGGARAGSFPGAAVILQQLRSGAPRRRIGLRSERVPVRADSLIFRTADDETAIGRVTSGGFSPSLQVPIAVAYLPAAEAFAGNVVFSDVRGRRVALQITALPFVPHRYKRDT